MVRNASRALKISVHLAFDPNFNVEIGTFYPEKFRQAYYTTGSRVTQIQILRTILAKLRYYFTVPVCPSCPATSNPQLVVIDLDSADVTPGFGQFRKRFPMQVEAWLAQWQPVAHLGLLICTKKVKLRTKF